MKWHENNLEMAFTSICVKREMEARILFEQTETIP